MACVQRFGVCAFVIGLLVCAQGVAEKVSAKGAKEEKINNSSTTTKSEDAAPPTEFQWMEHKRLSWDDFKGPVRASDDESAAATHCGMGFRINGVTATGKPDVTVYNTFYAKKSWVRSDAKISSILDHEQGHFDLCELYTRKLRIRIDELGPNVPNLKQALMAIFTEVNNEYEVCQQRYEDETTHGINIPAQRKWMDNICKELSL